jgi:mannan endo-1,4-beta-mannosidase
MKTGKNGLDRLSARSGYLSVLLGGALLLAIYSYSNGNWVRPSRASPSIPSAFVSVRGEQLFRKGKPYRFIGTNLWYGMNLGSLGAGGDRSRLIRELDRLQALGLDNLRILALSEGPDSEPWRMTPSVQPAPGVFREELLQGLDFLLAEMDRRGMVAVVCLGNFWPWSGGMSQYLNWAGAGSIPYPPPQEGGSWETYQRYTDQFYSNTRAVELHREAVRKIVTRRNAFNGRFYLDDPTIMAWELANEPRGGKNRDAFNRWISELSTAIKSWDSHHLVTTGSEGLTASPSGAGLDFNLNHRPSTIDYATAHIWAQNWGWYDPEHADLTFDKAIRTVQAHLRQLRREAMKLGKPLVVEEFGLARDGGSFDPKAPVRIRDQYFARFFDELLHRPTRSQAAFAGMNFWAWSGEGRPAPQKPFWKDGDAWLGDPPHEMQGWYGVYDSDQSTLEILAQFSKRLRDSQK